MVRTFGEKDRRRMSNGITDVNATTQEVRVQVYTVTCQWLSYNIEYTTWHLSCCLYVYTYVKIAALNQFKLV